MPPSARMLATSEVVVVLPWVPAIAMPCLKAHQLGEHLRARHHRDVALARRDHLGVVGLHRGGHHHHVGVGDVGRVMAPNHVRAHLLQAAGGGVVAEVRAADA
jgi:hypothetical protein